MMLPATVGNISGTSVVEQLSVPSSHFFGCLQYPEIFVPLCGCSISVNCFLGQKLLDRERLVSCNIVMVENPIVV
jgi:hypothetical protein